MRRDTRRSLARVWGVATAAMGLGFVIRPHVLAGMATSGRHTPENTVVRILGGRQLLQGSMIALEPTPLLIAGGTVVDGIHVSSMLVIAMLSRRYRKAALTSAAVAGASGLAGVVLVIDGRR